MAIRDLTRELKTRVFVLKMSPSEYDAAKAAAVQYADGNLSAWFRYAATKFQPESLDGELQLSDDERLGSHSIPEKSSEKPGGD